MNTKRVLILSAVLAAGLVGSILALTAASGDSAALLPGINARDDRPNGCVDCHVKASEDLRLNTVLAGIKGHPDISRIVKKVPDGCLMCHKGGGKAPALGLLSHKVHFLGDAADDFLTKDKGQCLSCHSLDKSSGNVKVKSAPANW